MENGVIQGAVQLTGGLVYYQNFNGCENNSTINTWSNGAIKRYFPVTLPNNGGLACLDTYALIDQIVTSTHTIHTLRSMLKSWHTQSYICTTSVQK